MGWGGPIRGKDLLAPGISSNNIPEVYESLLVYLYMDYFQSKSSPSSNS